MRILVKTLPLRNGNYGGLFQALALQEKLRELGHFSATEAPHRFEMSLRVVAKYSLHFITRKTSLLITNSIRNKILGNFQEFAQEKVNLTPKKHPFTSLYRRRYKEYDAFVVGSDQVWRPAYCNVEEYMFKRIPVAGDTRPRVSYAASFGASLPGEFNVGALNRCKKLLSRFTAISVRESSAVEPCGIYLGQTPITVLDPTLLWDKEFYESMCGLGAVSRNNSMLVITLDRSRALDVAISKLANELDLGTDYFLPSFPQDSKSYKEDPSKYVLPDPRNWVEAIAQSNCIVTDSYHGMLFAIIFRKPFISLGNEKRGQDRFMSVLSQLGLERQLVTDLSLLDKGLFSEIDWAIVEELLVVLREKSEDFLRSSLR